MFDRHQGGERAILIHVDFNQNDSEASLQEFIELTRAAGIEVAEVITAKRGRPDPSHYVGSGKVDEVKAMVAAHDADVAMFNHQLSPSQERNLEASLQCRVVDRIGLILDIFAQRAQSFEGKLQVELAQLRHLSTRLVRGWTHLERQKGGIGLRGPGETQLETDRRLLRDRIKMIQKRLEKVDKQRQQGRRARQRANIPTVSLVGYTNAGKSTLFNRLTDAGIFAADQLFATLDPTLRKVSIRPGTEIILADTVGFVQDLPHELIAAFRATLEESIEAEILLHLVDAFDERREHNIEAVDEVLREIGADEVPQLLVYNKIDLDSALEPHLRRGADGLPEAVWISAETGAGMELLHEALAELLDTEMLHKHLTFSAEQSLLRSRFYQLHCVENEVINEAGEYQLDIRINRRDWNQLAKHFPQQLVAEN